MTSTLLAVTAAVSSATIGGAYLVFTSMVLPAFDRLGADRAAEAMRAVNTSAERPPFLSLFFGSAAAAGAVVAADLIGVATGDAVDDGSRGLRIAGGGLVLVGFLTTIARNVPLNRALGAASGSGAWARYRGPWTRANTVRAVASIAGAALLVAGTPR